MSSFGKVVGAIALLLLAAVGLLMSLCGGIFTYASMTGRETRCWCATRRARRP